ncbi:MAG: hypothetical protein OES09_07360 [Gammaproteobacteria bacterium]|nr:hypothetical protein [Gammaproteobacteria bacterium]
MTEIPDFSGAEMDTVREMLIQRYQHTVETHLADAELTLTPGSEEVSSCPAVFWQERDCNFVVLKTGEHEYRCQFFYEPGEQFGTGHTAYEKLDECVAAVLQVQSDHEREQAGVVSGATGNEL